MTLPNPSPTFDLTEGWLDGAAATDLFNDFLLTAPWFRPRIRLYGKEHAIPRSTAWYGDPEAVYRYSGTLNTPSPWTESLTKLRRLVEDKSGHTFNSVLMTLYQNGSERVGWHADDEPELGDDPTIASLSLGASRRFVFRKTDEPQRKVEVNLSHGDLLVMGSGTQQHWQHSIPAQAKVTAPRINLTWRRVFNRAVRG